MQSKIPSLFTNNLSFKLLSLLITLLLWLLVIGRSDQVLTNYLEIQVEVPPGVNVKSIEPQKVKVSLQGPLKIMKRYFTKKKFIEYRVYRDDVNSLGLRVHSDKLELPFGLRVLELEPRRIQVNLEKDN